MKDAIAYGKRLEHEYRSGGASWEGAAGFSNKNSIYDYDLLLYRSLLEAQATGKKPDAAIRDFLTDFAKQEGRVGSLLDALGVVGGAAVCTSGAGTPACVAGILAAISSANHLSGDIQKAVRGQEARTVLVAALVDRLKYTKEQAEKLQFYIDIGVIAVTVGAGGYKIAVDAKRLEKADQALVKLNSDASKGVVVDVSNVRKGTPEYEALNNPKPNATTELSNGTTFKTGAGGYVDELTYRPIDSSGIRDSRQTVVGKEGIAGDVGGHIQACRHGGTCDRFNLFPQNSNFNNSAYKQWENEITRSLQNGDNIGNVTVRLNRADPYNSRPDSIRIEYSINGEVKVRNFKNESGG